MESNYSLEKISLANVSVCDAIPGLQIRPEFVKWQTQTVRMVNMFAGYAQRSTCCHELRQMPKTQTQIDSPQS